MTRKELIENITDTIIIDEKQFISFYAHRYAIVVWDRKDLETYECVEFTDEMGNFKLIKYFSKEKLLDIWNSIKRHKCASQHCDRQTNSTKDRKYLCSKCFNKWDNGAVIFMEREYR